MGGVRVLVGTRKGAFILTSDEEREEWDVSGPHFAGWEIYHLKGSPADPNRLYASQTSGWFGQMIQRSDDGGATWDPANEGTVGMAEDYASWIGQPANHPGVHRCVHKVVVHPSRPETLFMQAHVGVYRSDDGGTSWQDIGASLPSPFGFPIAAAPDPGPAGCRVWVIPQDMETLRTPDG